MTDVSSLSVDDLGDYLIENDIPPDAVLLFCENKIDGESFLELCEADVKEMVKPIGVIKKIMKLLNKCKIAMSTVADDASTVVLPSSSQPLQDNRLTPQTITSTPLSAFCTPQSVPSPRSSSGSTVTVFSSGGTCSPSVPFSFSIPSTWRPSIMNAISSKTLTPEVRSEIIRDLVTHMYGCVEKPTSQFCKFVAQRLILKYPFMRDGKGTGYGTWEHKLYDRVHNMKRKRTSQDEEESGTPAKRGRPRKQARSRLEDRYPTLSLVESDLSEYESNLQALKVELERTNPKDVYLLLMKHTFHQRREFILTGAQSCADMIHSFPGLKLSACVCFN